MGAEPIREMPKFAAKSAFWRDLSDAVARHLAAEALEGRPRIGDPRLVRKAAVVLGWFALSYAALLLAPSFALLLLATFSLALASAAIGFGLFHDANHGTLFARAPWNLWAARLCSTLLGLSRHLWVHKHQTLHHRNPNVIEWDDDLETRGFLRLSPESPWMPRYRHQEIKAVLYYGLNSLEWVLWKDFHCLAKGRMNEFQPLVLDKKQRTELLVSKALHFLLFILPIFLALPLVWAIPAFLLFHFTFSWVLAAVFQAAHITPEMEFSGVRAGDDWAIHQLRTTADFATGSGLANWFTGGLNHQIEHHLFPNVAHSHYPALRPIVRAAAARHGLHCHDLGSMGSALRQHFTLLKFLGARA